MKTNVTDQDIGAGLVQMSDERETYPWVGQYRGNTL